MSAILRSLGITFAISLAIGGLFYFTKGYFLSPFVIAVASQFILFFIWNSAMQVWYDHLRRQTDNEMYKEFSKMGADVECSYCGDIGFIPLDLSIENRYTCNKCGNDNRVVVDVRAVQTTEPTSATPQELLDKSTNNN